jgi:hypothetical protein
MPYTKRSASFTAEPVFVASKSGKVLNGLGWCVKVMWADGSIERLHGFASHEAAQIWIKDGSDQWLRGQPGIM